MRVCIVQSLHPTFSPSCSEIQLLPSMRRGRIGGPRRMRVRHRTHGRTDTTNIIGHPIETNPRKLGVKLSFVMDLAFSPSRIDFQTGQWASA